MSVMFDSSAWIEYFSGSELGQIVKGYIDSTEMIYTPVIGLLEIKNKYQREKKKWKSRIEFICDRSVIIDLDGQIALLGADIRYEQGLHTINALIYASARTVKSKLLTKDSHFKKLEDVIILE